VNFFRANVHRKGVDSGWYETGGNIFNIEDTSVTPPKVYDIVYKTQEVPYNVIEQFANDNIVNKQNRAAQNNYMAVQSLFNSIDEDMMKRMLADKMSYTLEDNVTKEETAIAPLLFRSIIMKSETPGRGQIKVLKDNFKELPEKIKGMDIESFNDHVRSTETSLSSFGHKMDDEDLVQYVLEAYKHSDDHIFNEHFKKREGKWLKGEINLTFKELLQDGQAEYAARKHNKESTWGALSQEQQEIIALSAKVDVLKKEIKQKKRTGPSPRANENERDTLPNNRQKDAWKFKSTVNGKQHKAGDKITKNGKDFWWCPNHHDSGMWCRHQPASCINNPNRSANQDTPATPPSSDNPTNETANAATDEAPTAEEAQALLSTFEVDSDDDE
jgi:hypothetical protein